MKTESLQRELASRLDAERVTFVDGTRPLVAALGDRVPHVAARPRTVDEASDLLQWADREGLGVIPRGSGTKLSIGNRPDRGDFFLETHDLVKTLEVMAEDLVVRVSAGTKWRELQDALAEHRLHIPLDPPDQEHATVGGICATKSFGPFRTGFGTVRDFVIGMSTLSPKGGLSRSGGAHVKNVTGYDLMKLHLGALGTLGVITEVCLRVLPDFEAEATLLDGYDTLQEAVASASEVWRDPSLAPDVLEIAESERLGESTSQYSLVVRFVGSEGAVDARKEAARALLSDRARKLSTESADETLAPIRAFRSVASPQDDLILARAVVRPSELNALTESLMNEEWIGEPGAHIQVSPATGLVDLRSPPRSEWLELDPALERLEALVRERRGRLYLLAAPLALRESLDAMGTSTHLMESIKNVFDPSSILNPGRHAGGL